MKIALCQAAGTPGDVAANLAAIGTAAGDAAAQDARLVIFPEAFLTGYNLGAARIAELAEPADGPALAALRAIAAEHRIAVLCGYCERDGEAVYNSALLAGSDGALLLNYRKTHLWGELDRTAFAAGDGFALAEVEGVKVGVLICYDVEFPEAVRQLALAGAQLIAVPTALMEPNRWIATTLVPARAAENQVFVAYANRVGVEGDLTYVGLSRVAAPGCSLLAAAGAEETLLLADVDLEAIARERATGSYLEVRRPNLYSALSAP